MYTWRSSSLCKASHNFGKCPENRHTEKYIRRLVDPASPSDIADLFASTDEDKESASFTYDELLDSDASSEPDDLYSKPVG